MLNKEDLKPTTSLYIIHQKHHQKAYTQALKPQGRILQPNVHTNSITSIAEIDKHFLFAVWNRTQHMFQLVHTHCHHNTHPQDKYYMSTQNTKHTTVYLQNPRKAPCHLDTKRDHLRHEAAVVVLLLP